jgi:hypothetical protein
VVVRLHQCRTADFRRGRRLGREDHIVTWPKPQEVPDWMSRAEYDAMPAQLTVPETRVRVKDKTKRARNLVIVTTLITTPPPFLRPLRITAYGFKASTASSGEGVVAPITSVNPTCSRIARYSRRVRSFPSVQVSMFRFCI